jgi:predicted PurR-regulated permease PerM
MINFSLNQLLKWLVLTLLFPLIFLNGWLVFRLFGYFQPLITIFTLATLLAFILNYPVSVIQQQGLNRNYAVTLVFIFFIVIAGTLGIILAPIVLEQFQEMAQLFPQWIDASAAKLQNLNIWIFGERPSINLSQLLLNIINRLPDELESLGNEILALVVDTIGSVSEALITIVLTFYLLLDSERLATAILKRLPLNFGQSLQNSLQQNLQNYLIGQVSLSLLMGISETFMFLAFRVQFGLLFGLGVGLLSLIPFGDVVSLVIINLIIASHDFWLAVKVFIVAFIIDQVIDQVIAPRLLGKFTGIRPIFVIISLLIGTYIGGVLGLLIAVPVAGLIKDAIDSFSASSYVNSDTTETANETLL